MKYNAEQVFVNVDIRYGIPNYGFSCIENNQNCLGDNRDAQYWNLMENFKFNNDSFYVIIGVMHTNLGQTTYSNVVVYENLYSPGPTRTNLDYNGSGLILPVNTNVDNSILENMFALQIARPHSCISGLPGWCFTENEVGLHATCEVTARNYLNPTTKTRPNLSEILPNILLEFTTK